MSPIRVLVAEDDSALRPALGALVDADPDLELVGLAADASEAIELATRHQPDVAVVDARMPGTGVRAVHGITRTSPRTRVLAFSAYSDRDTVFEMLRAGATGYLVKGATYEEVVAGVKRASRGEGILSGEVTSAVIAGLAGHLERTGTDEDQRREQVGRIRAVLERDALRMVYQPIVELRTGRTVGVEALARFDAETRRGPDRWFAEAAEVGLQEELELAAIRHALAELPLLPQGAYLSLNASPDTVRAPAFAELLVETSPERVVVEITEHARVDDYGTLAAAMDPLRSRGTRLAVDDAGSGFASLRHILLLDPDVVKIDISLTRGIDHDRGRRALASGLIAFASESEATVVAEGIETRPELDALLDMGVATGQGYFLARPSELPVPEVILPRLGAPEAHRRIPRPLPHGGPLSPAAEAHTMELR
jgi:EAL domain-containing protein (putative c-di-GMP-specific phosphodiesterase class I)/DNA-binding NarL/FixJ family response regulator